MVVTVSYIRDMGHDVPMPVPCPLCVFRILYAGRRGGLEIGGGPGKGCGWEGGKGRW